MTLEQRVALLAAKVAVLDGSHTTPCTVCRNGTITHSGGYDSYEVLCHHCKIKVKS